MSQENVKIVRKVYEGWVRTYAEALEAAGLSSPDAQRSTAKPK
jgi:hypothetical protein